MAEYRVVWEIDLEADDPHQAALEALRMQRDPEAIPPIFTVREDGTKDVWTIDTEKLAEVEQEGKMNVEKWEELGERLLAWEQSMGGWDAPVWGELREALRGGSVTAARRARIYVGRQGHGGYVAEVIENAGEEQEAVLFATRTHAGPGPAVSEAEAWMRQHGVEEGDEAPCHYAAAEEISPQEHSLPDPYERLRSREQFTKFLAEDREGAVRLLLDAKVQEWLNDGPEEVTRCLTCWADNGIDLGDDEDILALAESFFE